MCYQNYRDNCSRNKIIFVFLAVFLYVFFSFSCRGIYISGHILLILCEMVVCTLYMLLMFFVTIKNFWILNFENVHLPWTQWLKPRMRLFQNSPLRKPYLPSGKPSPPWPSPWGGASAMCTQIFVAFSRQFSLSSACQASATASGPSPPPEAKAASSQVFISFADDVKSCTCVTKLESWGGWSRYSMSARWTSDFSLATISSTILRMFWSGKGWFQRHPHNDLTFNNLRPRQNDHHLA